MDINRLCCGCFRTLPDTSQICPYCGFDLTEYETNKIPEALAPRTILRGTYLVGKTLGKGGFGITYIGYHLALGAVVAIKELFPEEAVCRAPGSNNASHDNSTVSLTSSSMKVPYEKTLQDFMREARTVWEIDLPGVVKVTDCFEANGTAYMVMKYIAGKSLREYLVDSGRPMPEKEVLGLLKPVILSLQKLHDKGIIHRDISPDNMMLGEDGKVTLVDFGAARRMMPSRSNAGRTLTVVLKPGYAPIEQYNSRGDQGPWTDVYALCATMYKLLTGLTPEEPSARFNNPSDEDTILGNLRRNGVSEKTCLALIKGMKMVARDRWQSVNKLGRALYGSDKKTIHRYKPVNKTHWYKRYIWLVLIILALSLGGFAGVLMNRNMEDRTKSRGEPEVQQASEEESQTEPSEASEMESQMAPGEESEMGTQAESSGAAETESQKEFSEALEAESHKESSEASEVESQEAAKESSEAESQQKSQEENSHYRTIPYLSDEIAERFELADFVGEDYRKLLSETGEVSVLEEKDHDISLGNTNVSIKAREDGIITRVRLDSSDYDFCVEGLCSNLGTSDAHYILYNSGYVEGNVSEDGKWRVFTNKEKGRFIAYRAKNANIDKLYYGLIGYMPFKQK